MRHKVIYGNINIGILLYTLIFAFLSTFISQAQDMAVPVEIQYPLFLKILTFDRNLKTRVGKEIIIGIVYQGKFRSSLKTKDELVDVIKKSSIKNVHDIPIKQVSINIDENDLESTASKLEIDVLYITPIRAVDIESITKLSRKKKIITLTGVTDYVKAGISVVIDVKDNQPQIVINLPGAKDEGVDFSSQLLRLSKVIMK